MTTKGRIVATCSTNNWLSGHYKDPGTGAVVTGGAYHVGGWITPIADNHGTNWVLSSDQLNLYRSQTIDRTLSPLPSGLSYGGMCINCELLFTVAAVSEPCR